MVDLRVVVWWVPELVLAEVLEKGVTIIDDPSESFGGFGLPNCLAATLTEVHEQDLLA